MRQLTIDASDKTTGGFSKLPMRQLTAESIINHRRYFSKLPMRQLTSRSISVERSEERQVAKERISRWPPSH